MDQITENVKRNDSDGTVNSTKVILSNEINDEEYYYDDTFIGALKSCLHLNKEAKIVDNESIDNSKTTKTRSKRLSSDQALYEYFKNPNGILNKSIKEIEDLIDDYINKGSDINYKGKFENNIMLRVAKWEEKEIAVDVFRLLYEKKAAIDLNSYGHSVLHNAAIVDNTNLIRLILEIKPEFLESETYVEKQTALHYAAKKGNEFSVSCLIKEFNANKEAIDHQMRTPLYVAAEHGQMTTVKILLDFGCSEKIKNINGQKALYWIIAKCPEVASEVLDKYIETNKFTRQDYYYLQHVEHEPLDDNDPQKIPESRSILALIVDKEDLNTITHPVITKLIKKKWQEYCRWRSLIDLFLTFVNIAAWNLNGILVPYQERYKYDLPADWWIIFLYLVGIIGIFYFIFMEIRELYTDSKYQERMRQTRLRELEMDRRVCYPKDEEEKKFISQEQKQSKKSRIIYSYLNDIWNWYDLISIFLLSAVIFTHIADVLNHDELLAKANLRIMSISNIFISLRLLKVSRVINQDFGMLVITITFVMRDLVVWLLAYVTILIPFTSSFYSLYGGKFVTNDQEESVAIFGMQTYGRTLYALYALTFGSDLDRDNMNKIDNVLSDLLIAVYIGLTTLITINIFIAMLSFTFSRIHDSARGYFLLQRASEIIRIENRQSNFKKHKHYTDLKEKFVDKTHFLTEFKETLSFDKFEPIKDNIKDINEQIDNLNRNLTDLESNMACKLAKFVDSNDQNESKLNDYDKKLSKIENDFDDLKKLVKLFIDKSEEESLENMIQSARKPKVDVLKLSDIHASSGITPLDFYNDKNQ